MRVLVVEDDLALARGLVAALRQSGLSVDHVADGAEAAVLAVSEPFGLLILDIGLPGLSGLEVVRRVRASSSVPIMLLTARDGVDDRVRGLDLGADDYLAKPFELPELEARVRALLRRGRGAPNPVLRCGALALDQVSGAVTLGGQRVELRRREVAVLTALMSRAGTVVDKERLTAQVFAFDDEVAPNALELYVARLRKKLAGGPEIRTFRGLGYMIDTG